MFTYRTDSGYIARLYGESSLSIVSPDGHEIYRTNHRKCEGMSGLIRFTNEFLKNRGNDERVSKNEK